MPRNILVYGGGAIGSIIGWRLAQSSRNSVSVVCRSNFQSVRNAGYTFITKTWGDGLFRPQHVFQAGSVRPDPSPSKKFDYVICANKATGNADAMLDDLRQVVQPGTTLVTAQNGMGTEAPLRRAFQGNTILTAICNIGCKQVYPGFVEQGACIKPHAFTIGVQGESGQGYHIDSHMRDELVAMGPDFESADSLQEARWRKLIFNSAWNSTTALSGEDTHGVLRMPGAAENVLELAYETYKIAIASGVELDDSVPANVVEVAKAGPPITPSTLQDARNRRPLELEPIFGFLVRQAAKVNVHAPRLILTYSLLQQLNDSFKATAPQEILSIPEQMLIQQSAFAAMA